jgi:nicotinamide riboside kinase
MKRIALIGPPSSGKGDLALLLATRLDDDYTIIDNYVDDLTEQTGLAFGYFSTYLGNLMIASERLAREYRAKNILELNSITCGTIIETTVYQAIFGQQLPADPAKQEIEAARMALIMQTFGMVIYDTFRYDHVFVLDLIQEKIDPERKEFTLTVDQEIKDCLAQFQIPAVRLSGTLDERLEKAIEQIEEDDNNAAINQTIAEASSPTELGVRGSSEESGD